MKSESFGSSDSSNYTTVPSEMGPEMLCIEATTPDAEQVQDGIFIPNSLHQNEKMHYYRIIKQGCRVHDLIGTNPNDYVFVDMLARFADTFPISFVNARSVLFITDKNAKTLKALKHRVILKCIEPSEKVNEFGFIQINDIDPYGIVTSIGEDCEDRGFCEGDELSIVNDRDAATYVFGKDKYFDYHYTSPIFKSIAL